MQKFVLYLLAFTMVVGVMSCKNAGFRKAPGGRFYYKIMDERGTGDYVRSGNVLKFDVTFSYKDSILQSTIGKQPVFNAVDSARFPPGYFEVFTHLRKGDSLVIKTLTDSVFRSMPWQAWAKHGEYLTSGFRILDVFKDQASAQADEKQVMAEARTRDSLDKAAQLVRDDSAIVAYLAAHNIQATKTPIGTYVQIINAGTGPKPDSAETVGVRYTGRSMDDGKVFDSDDPTVDSSFHRHDTLKVVLGLPPGRGGMIAGFSDGIKMLPLGTKARLFIPSSQAYGKYGRQPKIKPNENLIFDIDVLSITTTPKSALAGGQAINPSILARMRAQQQAAAAARGKTGTPPKGN